jgi:putative NADPH-quinone reductase
MSRNTCLGCGTVFYSNFYGSRCSACQQTDKLSDQMERDRQLNREAQWQQERMHEEQMQQNQAIAALNALNALKTASAIERQTQAIFETAIKQEDAYQKGFDYINSYFGIDDNPYDVQLEVSEDGVIFGWWDKEPYITPTLNERFFDGMYDFMGTLPRINKEQLAQQAYLAGKQNAAGTLDPYFFLNSGFIINNVAIHTAAVNSNFEFDLDEDTGKLGMSWNSPFQSDYLNVAYDRGVDEVFDKLNTPEMKQFRLETEVVELKRQRQEQAAQLEKERKEKEQEELIAFIFTAIFYSAPVIGVLAAWFLTSGFLTFFLIAVIVTITINVIK